jgi:hypothetical protein
VRRSASTPAHPAAGLRDRHGAPSRRVTSVAGTRPWPRVTLSHATVARYRSGATRRPPRRRDRRHAVATVDRDHGMAMAPTPARRSFPANPGRGGEVGPRRELRQRRASPWPARSAPSRPCRRLRRSPRPPRAPAADAGDDVAAGQQLGPWRHRRGGETDPRQGQPAIGTTRSVVPVATMICGAECARGRPGRRPSA